MLAPVDVLAEAGGELVDQEVDQQRDVLLAVAERGHPDGKDAEAVVEVFAECLVADGLEQVAVGGRQHAHVGLDRGGPADAVELALLEDAQQLGLRLRRQLADLVEEEGAALGQLEAADAPRRWPR